MSKMKNYTISDLKIGTVFRFELENNKSDFQACIYRIEDGKVLHFSCLS